MSKFASVFASALTIFIIASHAAAQTPAGVPPAPGKYTVGLSGAFQVAKQDIARTTAFQLYEEEARVDVVQTDIEGGGLLDVGGYARLRGNLGAGLSYTFVKSNGDGSVNGSIPHPLVFDSPRTLTASVSGLGHQEQAVHLYATYYFPFTETIDFTVMAGPSFFNVKQDFIRTVAFSETPPFDAVTVDEVALTTLKENAVGFNIGIDATYKITRMFSAGMLVRFARAEADFTVNEGDTVGVKAGGFQIGGGVRVRF